MEIKIIEDKETWEKFLEGKEKTFLQSWNWGEFQKKLGEEIFRLSFFEENKLLALSLVIRIRAKRGNFFLIPHGPILRENNFPLKEKVLKSITLYLKNLSRERVNFLRIAPIFERNKENKRVFKELGYREAPLHIHPEITWLIDISKPEDEIFANFRKVHRNLIRRAQKEGVSIEKSDSFQEVEKFNKIYQETAHRQKFVPFSEDYLKKEFESFNRDKQILIFTAKYQDQILSSAFIIFYDQTVYYHQGASIHSKIPAPYLLQWAVIKEAKKRGCQRYNMWGVAPLNQKIYQQEREKKEKINPYKIFKRKHPWFGLSLFKTGFGGQAKFYLKSQDLPFNKKYFLNFIVEKSRKIKRRY